MKARCAWIKPLLPFSRLPPASAIFGPVSLLTAAPRGDGTQSRNQSNEPPLRDSLLFKSDLMPLLSPTLPRDPKGGGFNWLVHNGFNKVIMHILPSRQEREILVEATRTLGSITSREGRPDTRERRKSSLLEHAFDWNYVCSMCVRFATQQRDTIAVV